jgi:hypothetical protein
MTSPYILAGATLAIGLLTVVALLVGRRVVKKRRDLAAATEFIGVGPDFRSRRVLHNTGGKDEVQIRNGPLLKVQHEGVSIDQETGRKRYVFNLATGLPLIAMNPVQEFINYMHAAVFHTNKSIERVHRSHGEIPWVQIVMWGVLGLIGFMAIIGGAAAYIATHVER